MKKTFDKLIIKVFLIIPLLLYSLIIDLYSNEITITGKVLDLDSVGVAKAGVTFISDDGSIQDTVYSDENGNYTINLNIGTNAINKQPAIPEDYQLFQNYPNPFNPGTWIPFNLPKSQKINLEIYNLLGQKVYNIENRQYPKGTSKIYWNGRSNNGTYVSAGLYFYSLRTDNYYDTKKMLLLDGGGSSVATNSTVEQSKNISQLSKKNYKDTTYTTVIVSKNGFHNYREENYQISGQQSIINKNMILYPLDSLKFNVTESDYLLEALAEVDIYHHTVIINCEEDSICFNVKTLIPDSLNKNTRTAPIFGWSAYCGFDYTYYWDYPRIENMHVAEEPDERNGSYTWKDLKIGPHDVQHIMWNNYYRDNLRIAELFNINGNTIQYMDLQVVSNYSIQKNPLDNSLIDITISPIMTNTGDDTLFAVKNHWHIPRMISDISGEDIENTELYTLESDTVYNKVPETDYFSITVYYDRSSVDGFNNNTGHSPEFIAFRDTLAPGSFLKCDYTMTIKPLLQNFEIFPRCITYFQQPNTDNIWEKSIITIPEKNIEYSGNINYLRVGANGNPPDILFKIRGNSLDVVAPWETDTTSFYPAYGK